MGGRGSWGRDRQLGEGQLGDRETVGEGRGSWGNERQLGGRGSYGRERQLREGEAVEGGIGS